MSLSKYQFIRNEIHKNWDPIGIWGLAQEMGEYDSYVQPLLNLLEEDATIEEVFEYLWKVETNFIGLNGDRVGTEEFATEIIRAFKSFRVL